MRRLLTAGVAVVALAAPQTAHAVTVRVHPHAVYVDSEVLHVSFVARRKLSANRHYEVHLRTADHGRCAHYATAQTAANPGRGRRVVVRLTSYGDGGYPLWCAGQGAVAFVTVERPYDYPRDSSRYLGGTSFDIRRR